MEHGATDDKGELHDFGQDKEHSISREHFYQTLLQVFNSKIVPYVERLYQVKELLPLLEITQISQ
jgi:hypothetical protein